MKSEKIRKGNLTVEAALIMPVILSVIVILVSFTLFLYNRSVMTDAAILAAEQVIYYEGDETNSGMVKIVKEKCETALADRLVGMDDIHTEISVGKIQSSVVISGELKIAEYGFVPDSISFRTIRVKASCDRFRPSQFIRNVRKGKKLKEWITERNLDLNDTNDGTIQTGYEPELSDSSAGMQLLPGGDVFAQ